MLLLAPAMDQGASGEQWVATCRMDSARTSRWPTLDLLEERRRAQETVDVLSHHAAACLCSREVVICSSTRKWSRRPAISKSLMDSFLAS